MNPYDQFDPKPAAKADVNPYDQFDPKPAAKGDANPYDQFDPKPPPIVNKVRQLENSGNTAVSPAKAVGRFQITHDTALTYHLDESRLTDPVYAQTAATRILSDLQRQFPHDEQAVLVAYNAGPARARQWIKGGRKVSDLPPETQKYLAHALQIDGQNPYDIWASPTPPKTVPPPANPAPKPAPPQQNHAALGQQILNGLGEGYKQDWQDFLNDYTKRINEAKAEIAKGVAEDLKQYHHPTLLGALPNPVRDFTEGAALLNYATVPYAAALTTVVGRPTEMLTGGKVNRDTAADIIMIFSPLAEAIGAEAALSQTAKKMGVSMEQARMVLEGNAKAAAQLKALAKKGHVPEYRVEDTTGPKSRNGKSPKRGQMLVDKKPPPEPEGEAPILRPGKDDEPISETLTRHEDAQYRLKKRVEANMNEAAQALDKVDATPEQKERLHHAIEQRLIDPEAPIPEDLKALHEQWEPRREYQRQLFDEIKALRPSRKATKGEDEEGEEIEEGEDDHVDEENRHIHNPGYVTRIRADKPGLFKSSEGGEADPITGPRRTEGRLSKTTGSLKARSGGWVRETNQGREWVEEPPKGVKDGDTAEEGGVYRQATTAEIEANNPNARYIKDPFVNTEYSIIQLARVRDNLVYLNSMMEDLTERGLAWRKEWKYKNKDGQWVIARSNSEMPEGFQPIDREPALAGIYFHPRIAANMRDWIDRFPDEGFLQNIADINRMLIGSLFYNPFAHDANIWAMWTVGRGFNWVTLRGWRSLLKNGAKAMEAVITRNEVYNRYLREGFGLQFARAANANFYKTMVEKAGIEIEQTPEKWEEIANAFGFGLGKPGTAVKDLVSNYYRAAQSMMWEIGDLMVVQRGLELEEYGYTLEQARKQASREIADYRIPTEIGGSRAASWLLKNNQILVFSPYHYNVFRSYAAMFKDVFEGTPEERADAAGRWFVMAVFISVIAPVSNIALQAATHNKNAKVKGAGLFSLPDRFIELTKGQKEMADVLGSYFEFQPVPSEALQWTFGRGRDWTGRPIIEPNATTTGKVVEAGEHVAGLFPPAQTIMSATKPDNLLSEAGKQLDLDIPTDKSVKGRQGASAHLIREAARREATDPYEQLVKQIAKWLQGL